MKKYITAPIGSAIIIPGFGQVLNGQLKKGLIFMGIVFVLFVAGVIKLIQVTMNLLPELEPGVIDMEVIHEKINLMDHSMLSVIVIVFLAVWAYSVIDAFVTGIKIERERKQN